MNGAFDGRSKPIFSTRFCYQQHPYGFDLSRHHANGSARDSVTLLFFKRPKDANYTHDANSFNMSVSFYCGAKSRC